MGVKSRIHAAGLLSGGRVACSVTERALTMLETALAALAKLALLGAMIVVSLDAIGRYAFHAPLSWASEALTMYFLPVIFFFGLGMSLARRAHVAVDIVVARAPLGLKLLASTIAHLLGFLLFGLILLFSSDRLTTIIEQHEVVPGVLIWPLWPSFAVLCAGTLVASLRSLLNALVDLAALVGWLPVPEAILTHSDERFVE